MLLFMNCGRSGSPTETLPSQNGGEPYGGTASQPTFVDLTSPCPAGFYSHVIRMRQIDETTYAFNYSAKDCQIFSAPVVIAPENWIIPNEQFTFDGRVFTLIKTPGR